MVKPVKDVTVTLYQQNYQYETRSYSKVQVGQGKTDAQGFTSTDMPAAANGMQIVYELTYVGKRDATGTIYMYNYQPQKADKDEWDEHISIFSDRSIYRPGQTVYFKAICAETHPVSGENRPMKSEQVDVELVSPDGRTLKSLELNTNDFGSVHGSSDTGDGVPRAGQAGPRTAGRGLLTRKKPRRGRRAWVLTGLGGGLGRGRQRRVADRASAPRPRHRRTDPSAELRSANGLA